MSFVFCCNQSERPATLCPLREHVWWCCPWPWTVAPLAQGAINCCEVTSKLAPCIPYLKGPGGVVVPPACCSGIKTLNGEAQTTPDRQAVCNCLKSADAVTGINLNLASGLPGMLCGVSIPYQISPSTDCKCVK